MTIRSRHHFLAMAARLMRQILVDHARRRGAEKRGGTFEMVGMDEARVAMVAAPGVDVVALDEALNQLAEVDARVCQVVELRYFGGLTLEETAGGLEVSHATVERDWAVAKAWLFQRLG
jgi:RNA polymerase sigma factor (TIGR02999 family)